MNLMALYLLILVKHIKYMKGFGNIDLNLGVAAISMSGIDASLFTLSNITLPAIITPAASLTFDVTYTPVNGGIHTASVNITSDDCNESIELY